MSIMTPESRCAYLRHQLQRCIDRKESPFAFFKHLMLSKSFLTISRHYDIYRLVFYFGQSGALTFFVTIFSLEKAIPWDSASKHEIVDEQSFDRLCNLFQLLDPRSIGIIYKENTLTPTKFDQLVRLLGRLSGRIALEVFSCSDENLQRHVIPIVELFHSRMQILSCDCNLFRYVSDLTPPMTLDFCYCSQDHNKCLPTSFWRHSIRRLNISMDELAACMTNIDPGFVYAPLKHLRLYAHFESELRLPAASEFAARFPNLRIMNLDAASLTVTPVDNVEDIAESFLDLHECARKFSDECRNFFTRWDITLIRGLSLPLDSLANISSANSPLIQAILKDELLKDFKTIKCEIKRGEFVRILLEEIDESHESTIILNLTEDAEFDMDVEM